MLGLHASVTQTHTPQGSNSWRAQRIAGAALIPLGIWFLIGIFHHGPMGYPAMLHWAAQPWVGAVLALLVGALFYHSALGLQVIIEDYVSRPFWQMILITIVKASHLMMATLSWFFIIRIASIGHG